jgi:glycosyltransferase involved in cell wall biosynthesis
MSFPKITIVTPTFNSSNFLEETILSVLNQNYPNLEYIIIDGGSTDGTIDIIKKYEINLAYWTSERDNGMYYAIQKGFEKSTGDIMAWLNSDDKYHEGALNTVGQVFSELQIVEWLLGIPSLYNRDGICVKVFEETKWSKSRFWIGDYRWMQQESVFWRRSLWEKVGGTLSLSYRFAADFDLWCRFFKHAQVYSIGTILSGFRLHDNQISVINNSFYEAEVKKVVKTIRPEGLQNFRFILIKSLWRFKNLLIGMKMKITYFLASVCGLLIDKLHLYPPGIYFDFKDSRWDI